MRSMATHVGPSLLPPAQRTIDDGGGADPGVASAGICLAGMRAPANLRIVVVVPTRNEENDIGRLLESLLADGFRSSDIVVVDNFSSDRTTRIASSRGVPVLLRGPNQSAQRNHGFRNVPGDGYLFLDADMEVEPGLRNELLALVRRGIHCAVVPERSAASNFLAKARAFEREFFANDHSIEAARFFSRAMFLRCGPYDEEITGGEDWLLSRRAECLATCGRTSKGLIHHEGQFRAGPVFLKYVKYGRGYYQMWRRDRRLFLEHANPVRPSIRANVRRILRKPVLALGLLYYKALTYTAGSVGFAWAALSELRICGRRGLSGRPNYRC